jgi:Asp-tRNA(Asn)/Glu-tRNA(Gln) amidotransferase A subunit family amidase
MKNLQWMIARYLLPALYSLVFFTSCSTPRSSLENHSRDHAFIVYWATTAESTRLRLAVKDLIDIKGVVTTAGSEYLARTGNPAANDASCLARARAGNVVIVGKTNVTEFAAGTSGMNDYFGTPRNRLNPKRKLIPGGSSSGSAVAVQNGTADVAFGTDTAGSIRTPAACCGILGLKTTFGLVSLKGVLPLSPKHMDTVGPMARDIPHLVQGMDLLQSGFAERYATVKAASSVAKQIRIGRLYIAGTDPAIDKAVDETLAAKGFRVIKLNQAFTAKWDQAEKDAKTVALADIWLSDQKFLDKKGVSAITKMAIKDGQLEFTDKYKAALRRRAAWRQALNQVFDKVDFIALPTLQAMPPAMPFFGRSVVLELKVFNMQNTAAVDFAGNPALAMPIPMLGQNIPTSLQLIGPRFSEAGLLNAGRLVESTQ